MKLIVAGTKYNNQVIDGEGATLTGDDCVWVKSIQDAQGVWHTPEHVTIRNFVIDKGSIRVQGLGANGQAKLVQESSRNLNHTAYCQQVAPKHITFEHMHIRAQDRIPFYVAPGCTHITLKNSVLEGTSVATTIYLCCESAHNQITHNILRTKNGREAIAIDGSAHNVISHNQFHDVQRGGIYLYRNSGEGGTIRHQSPTHNEISHNWFNCVGWKHWLRSWIWPAVWVGSRSRFIQYFMPWREQDAGYAFGSSQNNSDLAAHNVIHNNQPHNIRIRVWESS